MKIQAEITFTNNQTAYKKKKKKKNSHFPFQQVQTPQHKIKIARFLPIQPNAMRLIECSMQPNQRLSFTCSSTW